MASRSSPRAASITIGYIVLLVALFVIRVGRQQVGHEKSPGEPPRVASQPSAPPIESPTRIDKPAVIETPSVEPSRPVAAAPKPAVAVAAPPSQPPVARSRISVPETSAEVLPILPASPEAAATTGDARTVPDVDRTEPALLPAPSVPATTAVPSRLGELVEPMAVLPKPAAVPEVREISSADRIYEKESTALARVLGHYEQAYDRLDVSSAAAVWPSVDARALSRAFARLQSQDLDFGNCTFSVSASDAAARCAGVLRYSRRIGDTALKTEQHVWTIEFARAGESWQIVKISAQ
jgi:hypothetical protein